jgi:glyoxylase-like metal-dependent hydrolase (beta-lactamase superfamily II)
MEYLPGIHRIPIDLGGLALNEWVLVGDGDCMLVDSGIRSTPLVDIAPYLQSIDLEPTSIVSLVVTHSHSDHCGGNAAVKRMSPRATISAHHLEVTWIEHHRTQFSELFAAFGDMAPELDKLEKEFFEMIGEEVEVDIELLGSEMLPRFGEYELRVVNTPGHTKGHIALHDKGKGLAIAGDAIQGRGITLANNASFFPLYTDVDSYMATLRSIKGLGLECLLTAHCEPKTGEEIAAYINESEAFVSDCEEAVFSVVHKSSGPRSLDEIAQGLVNRYGTYEMSIEALWICKAHLKRLVASGRVVQVGGRWRAA